MDTNTINKVQSTGRGRYTNTIASNRDRDSDVVSDTKQDVKPISRSRNAGDRDLHSGLEILDVDFLLTVVENVDSNSPQDITMRKLSINEIIRTHRVHEIDSQALKVYAMDMDGQFGKDVQVESFKELAERTASSVAKS